MIENGIIELDSVGYYRYPKHSSLKYLGEHKSRHVVVRIFIFITGIFIIPSILLIIPVYLRHRIFVDTIFAVTESDVFEISDGISTLFCEAQTLKMNVSFNAFQIVDQKMNTDKKKYFNLKKNMILPDDTLEYWGFFLNKGSIVNLSLCSRHEGGRIMIVKDINNFHMCGLDRKDKVNHETHSSKNILRTKYESNDKTIQEEYEGEDLRNEISNDNSKMNLNQQPMAHTETSFFNKKNENLKKIIGRRKKRSINGKFITHMEGLLHGKTNDTSDSSVSSFEESLISCHDGRILLNNNFIASHICTNLQYLENGTHTQIQHEVDSDDYYFYIFYSDNDLYNNEIYTIFNILKPTYEYSNYTRGCINQTICKFPISLLSNEKVIVEIPVRDGIEHEMDDVTMLESTCEPRTIIYSLFPITVLVFILLTAFMGT